MAGTQTIDTNHEDMIHDAQLDYYGTTLATASSDESIKIFDVRNKKQVLLATLHKHKGPVWSLSWSHPMYGNLLASCGYDRKVIIWRELGGQWDELYEFTEHTSSVNCVAWAPHPFGLILACASSDGTISILSSTGSDSSWHAVRIQNAHTIGVNSISWAPAINADFMLNPASLHAVSPLIKRIVSGGCDSIIKIWREDTSSGAPEWIEETRLEGHSDWVRDVSWAPSLNIARQLIASCGQDGRVIVWQSISNAEANNNLGPASSMPIGPMGGAGQVTTMASATTGATGGTVGAQPATTHLDPKDYAQCPGATNWRPVVLATYPEVVWHVSWSLTGNILAVSGGDNKITLWKETLEGGWIALSEVNRSHDPASLVGMDEHSQASNLSMAAAIPSS
ncbi:Protein transport protein SEC13 [Fasciola gigantica]|uniref:Protein SEC13 homolog n=1 Tax=Fasciola gigantica TaxID=46835 RepID=A0A504YVX9_FASGI|nr:Protein transport protein SEC13 [Fasciola gigantica]